MSQLTLEVDDMTCGGCAARVEKAIRRVPGVQATTVTRDPGRAVVQADDNVTADQVAQAISAAGYPARPAAGGSGAS